MNVTTALVVEKILAHLNGQMSERELVDWAEDALIAVSESDIDLPNEDTILDVLTYIAAGDSPGFPLSWSVLSDFLRQLGTQVRFIAEAV